MGSQQRWEKVKIMVFCKVSKSWNHPKYLSFHSRFTVAWFTPKNIVLKITLLLFLHSEFWIITNGFLITAVIFHYFYEFGFLLHYCSNTTHRSKQSVLVFLLQNNLYICSPPAELFKKGGDAITCSFIVLLYSFIIVNIAFSAAKICVLEWLSEFWWIRSCFSSMFVFWFIVLGEKAYYFNR